MHKRRTLLLWGFYRCIYTNKASPRGASTVSRQIILLWTVKPKWKQSCFYWLVQAFRCSPGSFWFDVSMRGVLQAALQWGWDVRGVGRRIRCRVPCERSGSSWRENRCRECGGKPTDCQRPVVLTSPLTQLQTAPRQTKQISQLKSNNLNVFYEDDLCMSEYDAKI